MKKGRTIKMIKKYRISKLKRRQKVQWYELGKVRVLGSNVSTKRKKIIEEKLHSMKY